MDSLEALALIAVLGGISQWVAWRLHLPSILFLLVAGIVAGPVMGWIDPDVLFGQTLYPAVSLIVCVLLFEGGLTLNFRELRTSGVSIRNLVSIGMVITWVLSTLAARFVLNFSWEIASLFGAILTVTGPTVIVPILRTVRPSRRVGHILKWEGIMIDPIGVLLAVLVFEVILSTGSEGITELFLAGVGKTLVVGLALGIGAAVLLVFMVRHHWLPDYLLNSFTMGLVLGIFALSNLVQHESGLFACTVMGVALANQRIIPVKKIHEFKSHLGVMLIAGLFIVLAARIDPADIEILDWRSVTYLTLLVLLIRPLSVWVSLIGRNLSRQEKCFLMFMAPRGVVAMSVSSVFAFRLEQEGFSGADQLLPQMVFLICATVAIYGLGAAPLARLLGLSNRNPQGVLMVGASFWVRDLACKLHELGFEVVLLDSNSANVNSARNAGLQAEKVDVLADDLLEEIEIGGLGRALILTPNDEVNTLTALRMMEVFGQQGVYQLAPESPLNRQYLVDGEYVRGRFLFNAESTYTEMRKRFSDDVRLELIELNEKYDFEAFRQEYGKRALPLFLLTDEKTLRVFNVKPRFKPASGHKVLALIAQNDPKADRS